MKVGTIRFMFKALVAYIISSHAFDVLGLFLLGLGVTFAFAFEKDDMHKAHYFFFFGFLIALIRLIKVLVFDMRLLGLGKYVWIFLIFGFIGLSWLATYDWVERKISPPKDTTAVKNIPGPNIPPKAEEAVKEPPVKTVPAPEPPKKNPPQPQPPKVAPYFGNLRERCLELSKDLSDFVAYREEMKRKNVFGDQTLKHNERMERMHGWSESTTSLFRGRFLERLVKVQQELASFHIRDERVDDILAREQEAIERERIDSRIPREIGWTDISKVEELAKRIKVLADKVREVPRSPAEELQFSEKQMQPDTAVLPHKIEVTITARRQVKAGYIVVQFDRALGLAVIRDDLADGNSDLGNPDLIANKEVVDLISRNPGAVYAIEIGKTPFVPETPVRVVVSNERPIHVIRVMLFDE